MITDKQIEKAAEKYGTDRDCAVIGRDGRMSLSPELEDAFKAGTHRAINEFLKDLWHDAKEEPNMNRKLLVQTLDENFYVIKFTNSCSWELKAKGTGVTRWLYIDDLLPKKGGEK